MTLKVLLSGTFSSGKTTTLRRLRVALLGTGIATELTTEAARGCPLPLNREQDANTSTWLLGDMIRQESVLRARTDVAVVLCDGGPPDVLAHDQLDADHVVARVCSAWQQTYDLTFWARPDPLRAVEGDGLRVVDDGYRAAIDGKVARAFERLGVSPQELPSSTRDRVVAMAASVRRLVGV